MCKETDDTLKEVSEQEIDRRVKYFTDQVYYWQRELGFSNVEINVLEEENSDARASWEGLESGMMISIAYSRHWIRHNDLKDGEIDKVAFHEVFESQFHTIQAHMLMLYDEDVISKMMHEIIRRAENHIYPALRAKAPRTIHKLAEIMMQDN